LDFGFLGRRRHEDKDSEEFSRTIHHAGCLRTHAEQWVRRSPYSQSYMLEYNDLMSAQSTRWVYSRIMFRGVEKSVRQPFIDKVDLNLCWLLSVMERHYGPLPEPAMPRISRDNIPAMFEKLREEAAQLEVEKLA
jgi:hypothetical protein